MSKSLPPSNTLFRTSKPAFGEWAQNAATTPGEVKAATEGVTGGTREAFSHGAKLGFKALSAAPGVLRKTGSRQQQIQDYLIKAGLIPALTTTGANGWLASKVPGLGND